MGKKAYFVPVNPRVEFPKLEEEVLEFWKKEKIFEKSIELRPATKKWTFLDGPPFITGLPHYGTLLSSIPKDLFPRYWTMKGYRVRRVWGWDCHGLPAENKVEEKLGIKRKKDIEEKVGVGKFIAECKRYVSEVSSEWEWYVDHIARWVDFKNSYKTMDLSYMETVMWVFSEIYKKGYIYKGMRVSLYCPHCETPISNFEVAMDAENYKEVTEAASTYKFQLSDEPDTYLLAWSTTPWNKLVTTALAVNPSLRYVKVKEGSENYVLAKSTLKMLKGKNPKILEEFSGKELVGRKFVPLYKFYDIDKDKKAFVVIGGDFVTAEEGTGIVTIAPYGEEDWEAMRRENIQVVLHVKDDGYLTDNVPNWGGMYYLDANPQIDEDLDSRGLLYRKDSYTHTMPHCWRCHTQLFYKPQKAWYVDIHTLKPKMKKNNEVVKWFPSHFKYGRFLKSMEAAPDWCISRSRYWGSPVPVWECECGERYVPGSIRELEELSGRQIKDLHKPEIDEVTIKCKKCGKEARRVPEVLDSWVEAGSASYAERHFPFEKGLKLENFFPPDFVVEYTGQIRAWFYVLHVIATALFDSNAFKNVVVTGVILGTDGRKMSKNYGNYPDPKEMLQKYGGDALRLYLMGSPVMRGEDILISEEEYRKQARALLVFWNIYNFFVSNANIDGWRPKNIDYKEFKPSNVLDRWILSRLEGNVKNVEKALERYDTVDCVGNVNYKDTLPQSPKGQSLQGNLGILMHHDLSTWYLRRMRDRVGVTVQDGKDKEEAYQTLWIVLKEYTKAMAPFVPFITERIYKNLTKEESVHLTDWTEFKNAFYNPKLEIHMDMGMQVASLVNALRKEANIRVRMPLKLLEYSGPAPLKEEVKKIVLKEVNLYQLVYKKETSEYRVSGSTNEDNQDINAGLARDLVRKIQEERKNMGMNLTQKITVKNEWIPSDKKVVQWILKKTVATKIEHGNFKVTKQI